jgi:hypothetical protein
VIVKPTVLVLGAGASYPYGFPTGPQLQQKIIEKISTQEFSNTYSSLYRFSPETIIKFKTNYPAAKVQSIDSFLQTQPKYAKIAKYVMAEILIPCEDERNFDEGFSSSLVGNDWCSYLLNHMVGPDKESFGNNKLVVLTFNYDRSFEWYCAHRLRARWDLSTPLDALDYVKKIPILHIHGTLGGMLWDYEGRLYEPSLHFGDPVKVSEMIRTIHDADDDNTTYTDAFMYLENAARIIFLGFGYWPDNLRKMGVSRLTKNKQIFGSAYKLNEREKIVARDILGHHVEWGHQDWNNLQFLQEMITF